MTRSENDLYPEEWGVLVFDICSSTHILEALKLRDEITAFRNVLLALKAFLESEREKHGLRIYKFLGDGWIVLFKTDVGGAKVLELLRDLSTEFEMAYNLNIRPVMDTLPKELGLTFGIDSGQLIRFRAFGQDEYIGRPLNIAARLQSAVKDAGQGYAGTALISRSAHSTLQLDKHPGSTPVHRELRNVLGGQKVQCLQVQWPFTSDAQDSHYGKDGLFGTGYRLSEGFDQRTFKELLKEFQRSVPRENDMAFVWQLEKDLLSELPHVRKSTLHRLAKWCNTGGAYKSAEPVARKISVLLFGEVLDRKRMDV